MFCIGCLGNEHNGIKFNPYSVMGMIVQVAAVGVMVGIDLPVCHRIADTVSLTTTFVVSTAISIVGWTFGYSHPNLQLDKEDKLSTAAIHNHIHEMIEDLQVHGHHGEEAHHHTWFNSVLEVGVEVFIGAVIAAFLPEVVVKMTHRIDIMHLIPGWSMLENTAPIISDGHGVAEAVFYSLAIIGPVVDIGVRGVSPAQLQQIYWDKSPISTLYNCYNNLSQCAEDAKNYLVHGAEEVMEYCGYYEAH